MLYGTNVRKAKKAETATGNAKEANTATGNAVIFLTSNAGNQYNDFRVLYQIPILALWETEGQSPKGGAYNGKRV